ncbi:hypothetical protein [Yersinia sp. 2105 StPb PI]|uniref:hypothetical protein n=1 Tax=Yersinia sp. 2105 StPb PI TaxID=2507058 RepID=UPI000FFB96E1|nr:hypothetical protein [Yersinia sp. 2105 StPb PI]RXA96923.1 hypothetical protein EQP49_05960 [Yersinia sp. 2105 StPb PI]
MKKQLTKAQKINTGLKDMDREQLIEHAKASGIDVPDWLINGCLTRPVEPLADSELQEFAELYCKQVRSVEALTYLVECKRRFGSDMQGGVIFRHEKIIMQIDLQVIETLLQHQIETVLLEERPTERYVAVMKFYMGDRLNQAQNGSTWMRDFIDSVFIEGVNALFRGEVEPTKNLH